MAIYHCSVKIVSRSSGRSSVGAAAYRAGDKLLNERDGIIHDYTKKKGIVYNEIMLPENAPDIYKNREILWNSVEKIEKDITAQTAREIEVALPKELSKDEQINLLKNYVKDNFTSVGMCADISLHDKKDGNPHAHIMLTMRPINEHGEWENKAEKVYICKDSKGLEKAFTSTELKSQSPGEWDKQLPYYKNGNPKSRPTYLTKSEVETDIRYKDYQRVKGKNDPKKTKEDKQNPRLAEWNKVESLEKWRSQWEEICNREFEKKSISERIDHRTLQAQGIDREPTIHLGTSAHQMEKRGKQSERGKHNEEVRLRNMAYDKNLSELENMLNEIKKQQDLSRGTERNSSDSEINNKINDGKNNSGIVNQITELYDEKQHEKEQIKTTKPNGSSDDSTEAAQLVAGRLQTLRNDYIDLSLEVSRASSEITSLREKQKKIENHIESIRESVKSIQNMSSRIVQLQDERQSLSVFKGNEKKQLNEQIQNFVNAYEQAVKAFRHDFDMDSSQADESIRRLKAQSQQLQDKITKNRQNPINDSKQMEDKLKRIEIQYKTEIALAAIHSDSKKIYEIFDSQLKRDMPDDLNEKMEQAKAESRLNNISQADYKEIVQRIDFNDAQKILEHLKAQGKNEMLSRE